MKKTVFTGAGVAIVTPMFEDGSINFDLLGELIDWQIEQKTDAIIATGTTGESPVLTDEEHCAVIDYTVKRVAGRIPVIAGTGSNDTAYAVELSQAAVKMGVDGLLLVTPYYNKTSQAGLVRHYHYIADRVDCPIILYNVPSRTGVNIQPQTYVELAKHPNIVATKEANGDISAAARTRALCGDTLEMYSGNDDQIVPLMSLGAKGVISVLSNIMPAYAHDIAAACLAGDFAKGAALQLGAQELIDSLFCDVNPIPVKTALALMGYPVGECRMPLAPMSDAGKARLTAALRAHGLLG